MPTAAKLFAALGFALVAYLTAEVIKPHMTPGTQFGAFSPVSGLIGLFCGWLVLGPSTRKGMTNAINAGMKTAVVALVFGLVLFSTEEMIVQAFRRSYDSPMEAVVDIFGIAVELIPQIFKLDVLAVLFGGGALVGVVAEWASRRWP